MPPRVRLVGRVVAVVALLLIARLTLAPQPIDPFVHIPLDCVVCGQVGGADAIANVVLFVPLGVGLALAGWRWPAAALAGLLLSLAVEVTQFVAIPGRYATLGDLLTNSAGALLGAVVTAHYGTWLRPTPSAARRLAVGGAAVWLAVFGLGGWIMRRAVDDRRFPPQINSLPYTPGFAWFTGQIDRATLDGLTIPHRGSGAVIVAAPARARTAASLSATGFNGTPRFVPLLFVHPPGDTAATLMLGVRDRDVELTTALRGRGLRLREPRLVLPDVLPAGGERTARYQLDLRAAGDSLVLRAIVGETTRHTTVYLGPTIAWAAVTPLVPIDAPIAPWIGIAVYAALALPVAYWARRATT